MENLNNVTLFTYTHTNCKDLWDMYIDSLDEHLSQFPSVVAANELYEDVDRHKFCSYDDNANYCNEIIRCLNEYVKTDFLIYMQEDFFLFSNPDLSALNRYMDFLSQNNDVSFVRLLKCGDVTDINVQDDLYWITEPGKPHVSMTAYSMQPTIWKIKDFIKLYSAAACPKFKENPRYIAALNETKINGVYAYNGEQIRGQNHYDSNVFPYVATAIVRGMWNTLEYPNEMKVFFNKYGIDPRIRGELT
jgi:hypothetical protein